MHVRKDNQENTHIVSKSKRERRENIQGRPDFIFPYCNTEMEPRTINVVVTTSCKGRCKTLAVYWDDDDITKKSTKGVMSRMEVSKPFL